MCVVFGTDESDVGGMAVLLSGSIVNVDEK